MNEITLLSRHPSPAGRPQPLAFLDGTLWMGSWDTDMIYAIDPNSWNVNEAIGAPGKPYGMAVHGDELRVVVSIGDDDDRFLFRFVPGQGFDAESKMPCPEFTGSHLTSAGGTLYMTQMGFQRIVALDAAGEVQRQIALPTRCGGIGAHDGTFYMISADEEFENLQLATLDVAQSAPEAVPVADVPLDLRALTFDGTRWWSSHREASEIVSFTP